MTLTYELVLDRVTVPARVRK